MALTLKEIKTHFTNELSGIYPSEEVQSFFSLLSEYILNYTRLDTVTNADEIVSEATQQKFENAIDRLKQFEPIQYITGHTHFFGLPLRLNKYSLIPRPETEELVAWIIEDYNMLVNTKTDSPLAMLDVGTGSGCIAIALARHLKHTVITGMDISAEVLYLAASNASLNEVDIKFIETDILITDELANKYDVIVSNPPYVRELEKEMMKANVLEYEPDAALFVRDNDPLLFYKRIGLLAITHLNRGGRLYFEINEYLGKELLEMLRGLGFSEIELRKDIFGKDRMLRCQI
jgi:release factor glutamine methyltransferase